MPNPKKIRKQSDYLEFEKDNVVSSQESTGLLQTPLLNEDESESFRDICDVPKQKISRDKGEKMSHR